MLRVEESVLLGLVQGYYGFCDSLTLAQKDMPLDDRLTDKLEFDRQYKVSLPSTPFGVTEVPGSVTLCDEARCASNWNLAYRNYGIPVISRLAIGGKGWYTD